ncbi:MAG TPA: exopolyphosphatase, partial [Bacteroidia bacterium]
MKFAAIDIGSNAIRLLFYNVFEQDGVPTFRKISLTRMPVRLGADVFTEQEISEDKIVKLSKTMTAFRNLIEVHEVISYKAYATSAMREALNGKEVIDRVFKESGVKIHIIDGETEAKVI